MIESRVIDRLNPLKSEKLLILADPQRMIRAGARPVDGLASENGFTVLFCSGNVALREMYENQRDDPTAKFVLVDRTRNRRSAQSEANPPVQSPAPQVGAPFPLCRPGTDRPYGRWTNDRPRVADQLR